MGISGLLPFVEKASKKCNLYEFKGQTLAIDAYCWLHKGSYCCADKLVLGTETNMHIAYCMKYVNMLLSFKIKPILVFDGKNLPAKLKTEEKRRNNRKSAKMRAVEFLRVGKSEEARINFRRAVDITHNMALQLMKECRNINVDCIVAPYEADAQLAYLNVKNIADVVVTEDSDLLTFGCKKVLFKLDLTGNGVLVNADKLYIPMQIRQENFNFEKFRLMCILSGCDYLESLPGIGLKKSFKFFTATDNPDIYNCLAKIPSYLNMRQLQVSDEYRKQFMAALATFKHQVVYDPLQRKTVYLNDKISSEIDDVYCYNIGELLPDDTAFQLAVGNLNPFTMKQVDNWYPNVSDNTSIWSKTFEISKPDTNTRNDSNNHTIVRETTKDKTIKLDTEQIIQKNKLIEMQENQKYDEKVMADINKLYNFNKSPPKKKQRLEEELITDTKTSTSEEELSPILTRKLHNPFIKIKEPEKRLSKFSRVEINDNKIVKSRFFETKSTSKNDNVENINQSTSNISLLDSIDDSVKSSTISKTAEVERESDLENLTPPESKETESYIQKDMHESKPNLFMSLQNTKSFRRVGLSKNKSKTKLADKNQPSILSMFQYMKK